MSTEDEQDKAPWRGRHVTLSFWAIVIVAVVVAGVQGYAIRENRETIERLQAAEKRQAGDRAENRSRFARSDRLLCQEIEKLKARDRKAAIDSHKNLNRNLRLLGITPTPEIFKLANENYRRALRETAPRKGGCQTLPPPER